jgi:hypothetical protein
VIYVREDIDIRLLDYFYYNHSEVDKAHSLVIIQEEPAYDPNQSEDKRASVAEDKH